MADITVTARDENGRELATMMFDNVGDKRWSVRIAVLTDEGMQMYQRPLEYITGNVLALVEDALSILPLEASRGPISPPDLDRRQQGTLRALQGGEGKLRSD